MRKLLLLGLILSGCAAIDENLYNKDPVAKQILTPREGFTGKLTNRVCMRKVDGKCVEIRTTTYDMHDKEVRELLIANHFSCNIAGKLYQICPNEAGFCRYTYEKRCFLFICKKGEKQTDFISVDKYSFLIQSAAECASDDYYDVLSLRR